MKNLLKIALSFSLLLMMQPLFAQRIMLENSNLNHKDNTYNCLEVKMEPQTKAVKKAFEDFMEDEYKVEIKGIGFLTNKDVLYAKKAVIPTISPNAMDLYAEVVEKGDRTRLCVAGAFGYDIDINPQRNPTEYRAMRGIVLDFLESYLPNFYQGKVEETRELVNDLSKQRENIVEDIADNVDEIEKLKKENEKLKEELEQTKNDLNKQSEVLKERESSLDKVNTELQRKND